MKKLCASSCHHISLHVMFFLRSNTLTGSVILRRTPCSMLSNGSRGGSIMGNGHVVAVTSIDHSRAFDSVDHGALLTKLEWYGIDARWFESYLGDRRSVVRGGSLALPLSHGAVAQPGFHFGRVRALGAGPLFSLAPVGVRWAPYTKCPCRG